MRSVRKLGLAGLVLLGALAFDVAPAFASSGYGFTEKFGSGPCEVTALEHCEGKFKEPGGVAVNDLTGPQSGDVYVVDRGNDRVEYFSSTGHYEGQFSHSFSAPEGIAVDNDASSPSKGDVYVADFANKVIDEFSATGTYEGQLTGTCENENESAVEPGACPGSTSKKVIPFKAGVNDVAVGTEGNVWVLSPSAPGAAGHYVSEFSGTGSFMKTFVTGFNVFRLAVDSSDNVYLLAYNGYVEKYSATGNRLAVIDNNADESGTGLAINRATNNLFVAHAAGTILEFGPFGEPNEEPLGEFGSSENLASGVGVAVSSATGTVYVADGPNNDVDIFMPGVGELPVVEGESTSRVTATEATLDATINPYSQSTAYEFEYATEGKTGTGEALEGTVVKVPGGPSLEGVGGRPVSVGTGALLREGTTYFYRVVATNATGTNRGKVQRFSTQGPPVLSTGEAQYITGTAAVLSGTVDPLGLETTYYFAYINQAGYEHALAGDAEEKADPYAGGEATIPTKLTEGGVPYTGTEPRTIEPILAAGLRPGTTYHYALVAKNALGVTTTPDATLTTLPGTPPTVSTGGASGVSQNSATLSGTVTTNSLQTEYGFEISTQPGDYGPSTGLGSLGGATTQAVSVSLDELQPGTTYYYRVTATNADGSSYGEPGSFTTPGFPTLVMTPASPPLVATPLVAFPTGSLANTGTGAEVKTLTNAEKLSKALKACHAKKGKQRSSCEAAAHKKYAPASKKKGATKKK